jgi:glycosyltransferase involved in cell wall biosynthesis
MDIDFSKWGVVGFKDSTGLGRMAADARKVLGLGRHLVAPSERMPGEQPNGVDEIAFGKGETDFERALEGLEGALLLERVNWGPGLVKVAKRMGVRLVGVVMWEWFRGDDPLWRDVDFLACPHRFALEEVKGYGFANAAVLPWPLDWREFPARKISGPARVFVHNAGLIDADDRKGTRETIKAFMRVRRDDLKLIVRMQNEVPLPRIDERIQLRFGNVPNEGELYAEGDVAVQPSKMEGIGFMVLEPVCAGLPVITTDYPPMNEWVRDAELRCALKWGKRRAFASQWVKQAHLRLPDVSDLARRIEWCAENDLEKFSRANRQWTQENLDPYRLRKLWIETLEQALKVPAPVNA